MRLINHDNPINLRSSNKSLDDSPAAFLAFSSASASAPSLFQHSHQLDSANSSECFQIFISETRSVLPNVFHSYVGQLKPNLFSKITNYLHHVICNSVKLWKVHQNALIIFILLQDHQHCTFNLYKNFFFKNFYFYC